MRHATLLTKALFRNLGAVTLPALVISVALMATAGLARAQAPVSDDFNGSTLNTSLWTQSAPAGGSVTVSNGHANLAVPGGSNHDAFVGGNNSVRILQTISNADFDVAAKFDSGVSQQYQGEGILVVQNSSTYIRFEIVASGSNTQLSAALVSGGNQSQLSITNAPSFTGSLWLRVTRAGNNWTFRSSSDGTNYTTAGSFTLAFTVAQVGPYAWNYNSNPAAAAALTASVDYFHNLAVTTTAAPTFSPASGTNFTSSLSVTISDSTAGATIYYTLDGSTPTLSSNVYSGPISLTATTTIKAIATASGFQQSSVASATYTQSAALGPPVSDDFNGSSLNSSLWTAVTPGGGSVSVSNGHANLIVPAGSNHDPFVGGNNSVRILQNVANGDFDVVTKFDSAATRQYEGEGILVVQDSGTYIRFELSSDGTRAVLSALLVSGGAQTQLAQVGAPSFSTSIWLQIQRTGNSFTFSSSTDGSNYTTAGSSTRTITMNQIGAYAWNYNANPSAAPAMTASVDYFYNVSAGSNPPVISNLSASTTSIGATITWTTDIASTSTVNYGTTPSYGNQAGTSTLVTSHSISITGLTCGTTYDFDVSSTSSANLTSTSPNATFQTSSCSNPLTISAVSASPSANGAVITWTTNLASSSTVNYGITTNYGSQATGAGSVTSHSVTLTALACSTTYDYNVSSTISSNASATSSNQTFTTAACSAGQPTSDSFDEPTLNTALWTFANPLGDGTVTMNGTAVTLNIPQGTAHDGWTNGNDELRLLQPVQNTDFTVEARFQSDVEIGNQEEGIMVQQDSSHFIRFDVINNGQNTILFAGLIQGSSGTSFTYSSISVPSAPIWLRLQRTGNQWIGTWSLDGVRYSAGASFSATLNVTAVGPSAGTATYNGQTPAFTAVVDYFFNTAAPVSDQVGPPPFPVVTVDSTPGKALVEKTLADIEGVGKLNPVVGLEAPDQGLYWYGYPSSGSVSGSWVKHSISPSGTFYEDIIPLDVNGDGAIDLVASYSSNGGSSYQVVWFENPRGSGTDPATVSQWTMHVIGSGVGEDTFALADIDGDGKIDIISCSYIYFQNNATSWTQVQYANSSRGVALLDIGSGNGAINLVTTGANSPYDVTWYENPRESGGNARTGTWIAHDIGAQYPCTSATCGSGPDVATYSSGDFNGDGRMDVVMGQSEGGTSSFPPGGMIWFEAPADRRNGTWIRHTIDPTFSFTHEIRVADMDKNGTLDLITSEQDQSSLRRVAVFFNDGAGNFTEQVISNAEGHNTTVGDVRGTGYLDILNSGHGYFGAPNPLQIFVNPRAQ